MKRCDEYEPSIERLLSDEIGAAERDRLLAHSEDCQACRQFVDLHHQLLDPELDPELPNEPDFAAMRRSVLREIRMERQPRQSAWSAFREMARVMTLRPAYAGAFAAAMLVVLAAGFIAGTRIDRPTVIPDGIPSQNDAILAQMGREAQANQVLDDVENSPYLYSNVSFQETGDRQLAMSFDVTRHVEITRRRDDPLVKEVLAQSLVNPAPVGTRLNAISYSERLTDPKIKQALIFAMMNDPNLSVRLKALSILSKFEPDDEIREAHLAVLSGDESVQMRMLAMDYAAASVGPDRFDRMIEDLRVQNDQALLVHAASYGRQH